LRNCKKIKTIPETLGRLSKLRSLDLSTCKALTHIPESLGQLPLEELNVTNCLVLASVPTVVETNFVGAGVLIGWPRPTANEAS
jgi:Leucine-rich repeat (LRR) protein